MAEMSVSAVVSVLHGLVGGRADTGSRDMCDADSAMLCRM